MTSETATRYFRGITVALPDAPRYRTLTDVVLAGSEDTQSDLYRSAQQRAEKEFGLKADRYATTWFELSPDVLVPSDGPPLPLFWTLALGWHERAGHRQSSIWGDTLALPHDTRSGLLNLVRRMAVKDHGVREDHAVLSFTCGPARLGEA
ncbi:hypothetical protein ACODT4_44355 [Streptomyces sp. 2.9]|uniref:hypothetical protein n=1 Tax=Streptomyces tritrimontium TaxID=3406573 RepID=UPI003BB596D9